MIRKMIKEEKAIILDFLPNGYANDPRPMHRKTAIAQGIGTEHFALLELIPKKGVFLQPYDEVYIGEGRREKIHHISGRLVLNKLTGTARSELEYAVKDIIKKNEKKFVDFFNNARPLTMRMHQIELLPGFGKKHMWQIIEERKNKPFESFEDLKKRVRLIPDPEKATARIISISVVFNDGTEYFISDMDEKKMLEEFWDIVKTKAEMVTGWNLRRFDWPYLINRSKQILSGVPFAGVQELDAMFNFQKIVRWNAPGLGMKLDDIAYEFLGFRKLDDFEHKEGIHALYESFLGDKKLLYEYNMRDAKLVALLDEYLHLSDPYIEISKEFPIMLRDTGYVSDVIEVLVLTTAQEVSPRIVFPRKRPQKAEIIGAITKDPDPGLHRNVMVLDFKSMYNAIIQAFYISPEIMKRFKKYYRNAYGRGVNWDNWESAIHFMREYVKFVKEHNFDPIFPKFLTKVEQKREYAKKMRNKYQEGDPEFTRWQLAQFGFKLILAVSYTHLTLPTN